MQPLLNLDEILGDAVPPEATPPQPVQLTTELTIIPFGHCSVASRRKGPVAWGRGQIRRLVENGFPAIVPEPVPESILATPKAVCPVCEAGVVMPELRILTGGRCYRCWEATRS